MLLDVSLQKEGSSRAPERGLTENQLPSLVSLYLIRPLLLFIERFSGSPEFSLSSEQTSSTVSKSSREESSHQPEHTNSAVKGKKPCRQSNRRPLAHARSDDETKEEPKPILKSFSEAHHQDKIIN